MPSEPNRHTRVLSIATVPIGVLVLLFVLSSSQAPSQTSTLDFDRMARQQAETDKAWRSPQTATCRWKRSPIAAALDDLDIPAFVFQPLKSWAPAGIPRWSGSTKTSAATSTSTTFPTSAKPPRKATSSSRRNIAAASATGRRFTTRSTTAAAEVDDVVTAVDV